MEHVVEEEATYSRKQWEILSFEGPASDDPMTPPLNIVAALGDFGGGKTRIAADRYWEKVIVPHGVGARRNEDSEPFTRRSPPMSGMVAPTRGGVMSGPLVELKKVVPEGAIVRERMFSGIDEIEWANGHITKVMTVRGALNPKRGGQGPTLVGIWADEIQADDYGVAGAWENVQSRARDHRAITLEVIVSGRASKDSHVEDIFRKTAPNRLTRILFQEDNPFASGQRVRDELLTSLSAEDLDRDEDGWTKRDGDTLYRFFSAKTNMPQLPPIEQFWGRSTSIGVDLGQHASVVFGQGLPCRIRLTDSTSGKRRHRTELGQVLVDEWHPDDLLAESIASRLATDERFRRWPIVAGQSVICMDPSASKEEVAAFRSWFPGVRIVRYLSGPYHFEETGIKAVRRGVRDGLGNARLFVHPSLARDPSGRGIVKTLRNWNGKSRWPSPKKAYEHCGDGVRYLVQYRLPLPRLLGPAGSMDSTSTRRESPWSAA